MTALDFDRHRAEITTQASLLAGHLDDADVTVPVPSCPGWNVSQLCRHVDGALRWANEIVATRAAEPPPQEALRDLSDATNDDAAGIAVALREAAAALSATLHGAGPGAQMWCRVAARRSTHAGSLTRSPSIAPTPRSRWGFPSSSMPTSHATASRNGSSLAACRSTSTYTVTSVVGRCWPVPG
jgi:hypothetical protein